jgi:two-component system CheB/CheR fusion protein
MAAPKKTQTKSQLPLTVQSFPIVGIGASAGGVDAFKRVLKAIPENSGMAYILLQHLHTTHKSALAEILQRVTKIPVHEITGAIHLAPDHIYSIPSNKILTSINGVLQLTPRENKMNVSIDIFFTSLADVYKECAIGIVLSGTGSDGTLGLKAIKEQGGISIVQDSESAAYDNMPQSAVHAGVVDFILTPEEIPAHLLLINTTYKTGHVFKTEEEELPKDDETIFKQILSLLRQRSGVDFTNYKQPTFYRRIARRIAIVKKETLADYLNFLRSDKEEQDALFLDVLIPVTSFFRDPKTFQTLTETIFPAILKNKVENEVIRIWIAGCSTGEEAFSIAICLHEFLTEKSSNIKVQIFASDISERAIKKARTSIYTKADLEKLSAIQIDTYFVKNNGNYEVRKFIRDLCVFAPHNFLKDPPFAKLDLITCRNVLIYMDTFLQKKAFSTFHYALKENGFLLLGKSETTGASSDLFTQVSKHDKIYSRKPSLGRFVHAGTQTAYYTGASEENIFSIKKMAVGKTGKTATKYETVQSDFRKSAEEIIISKSPASVVVNEQMDIVHIYGDMTPFLKAPQGKPTHNLIKMAREGLAFELRNAIHKSMKEKGTITKENISLKTNGRLNDDGGKEKESLVTIEIIPLSNTVEPHCLIRFEKKISAAVTEEKKSSSGKIIEASRKLVGQNEQLEKELSQSREDMRSITQDMEAANEELQSGNEELQSSNEEMQSLNEELETSKEELESTNEELLIVNQELIDKQKQLSLLYAEQVNAHKLIETSEAFNRTILESSPDCIKVLDTNGRIQYMSYNGLCEMEIDDFSVVKNKNWWTLWGSENEAVVKTAIRKASRGETAKFTAFCLTAKGTPKWWSVVVSPVRKDGEVVQQIISVSRDITEQKKSQDSIDKIASHFKLAADSANVGVWSLNVQTQELEWSTLHKKMWGYDARRAALTYEDWHTLIIPEDKERAFEKVEDARINHTLYEVEYRIKRANDTVVRWIKSVGQYYYNTAGEAETLTGISIDISQQKSFTEELEKKVNERTAELVAKRKELEAINQTLDLNNTALENANAELKSFSYIASHDLQEPLRMINMLSQRILQAENFSGKTQNDFNFILEASERMRNLIISLIDYSRIDRTELNFVPYDLNAIVEESKNDLQLIIAEKHAIIEYENLPVLNGLHVQLCQLFTNLISNAIKYSRPDIIPHIKITSERIDGKEINHPAAIKSLEYFAIKIADNGIGFEEEYATKIFEAFQRLHGRTEYSGTGIGLSIVKKIVTNHNGFVVAEGKPGIGSIFTIYLPT